MVSEPYVSGSPITLPFSIFSSKFITFQATLYSCFCFPLLLVSSFSCYCALSRLLVAAALRFSVQSLFILLQAATPYPNSWMSLYNLLQQKDFCASCCTVILLSFTSLLCLAAWTATIRLLLVSSDYCAIISYYCASCCSISFLSFSPMLSSLNRFCCSIIYAPSRCIVYPSLLCIPAMFLLDDDPALRILCYPHFDAEILCLFPPCSYAYVCLVFMLFWFSGPTYHPCWEVQGKKDGDSRAAPI